LLQKLLCSAGKTDVASIALINNKDRTIMSVDIIIMTVDLCRLVSPNGKHPKCKQDTSTIVLLIVALQIRKIRFVFLAILRTL